MAAGNPDPLIVAARSGDKRAVGRLISIVENDQVAARTILQTVYADSHKSWVTGLTGAPGAGKSTLVNLLIGEWTKRGRRVAVLAIDPTSPFTGGALLGDRIRMQHGSANGDVLVRSMATRGWLGGMARATERVATLCAGLGFDEVLIETVGATGNQVQGNLIGTDVTGTLDLGNSSVGISIESSANGNFIGGAVAGARNVIAGNNSRGILSTTEPVAAIRFKAIT